MQNPPDENDKKPKLGFDHRSISNGGRAETRVQLERKLDEVAKIARERDDEPADDKSDPSHPMPPIRGFLKLREAGMSASVAAMCVTGHFRVYDADPAVTHARVQFTALAETIHCLNWEDKAQSALANWGQLIERTHTMRLDVARWRTDALQINAQIDEAIKNSGGTLHSELPELPGVIAHFDVPIDWLEHRLASVASVASPDILNLIRGGGPRTRYSLGRLLVTLSEGYAGRTDGNGIVHAERAPAFSFEERLELIVDDPHPDAENGRRERYDRAEKAYRKLLLETRDPSPADVTPG